ncbi:hypothetical protein Cgig2_014174 [Carnegiea gigantea]|uniref:Uncharacterized protein n=1 Tax=Carnegiea gigantea TaxID=171969 RepID=A0A9Q1QEV5_9CARY|nr:hypothetical protein Cgig2_014174 [Carnegiea gigantea]
MYLLGLVVDEALPLLLPTALDVSCHCSRVTSRSQRPSSSPSLALHKTKRKSSQNQRRKLTNVGTTRLKEIIRKKLQLREPIQGFPITRLALPALRALHELYGLRHKLGDSPRLIVLPYIELEVLGYLYFLGRGFPKRSETFPQPSSQRRTRKSYFQCFTFDFFSMAVMNLGLLLKQYHPKSPVSLGALWTVCIRLNTRAEPFILIQNLFNHRVKRKPETVVESCAINSYTFRGRFIHGGMRLGDHEGIPSRQEGSDCPDHPVGPSGLGPLGSPLVDAPSKDELLNELSEEELEEASLEEEQVVLDATSALDFDEVRAEKGLCCIPSASSSLGDLMRGIDLVFAILRT